MVPRGRFKRVYFQRGLNMRTMNYSGYGLSIRVLHGLNEPLTIRNDRIGSLGRGYWYGDQEVSRDEMLFFLRTLRGVRN